MAELVAVVNQDGEDSGVRRPKGPTKYPWIDVMRAIAILGVVAHHAYLYEQGLGAPVRFIGGFGKMGVQLFFVASAITLCLSTAKRTERHPVLSFYTRRYFRIAPLYYLGIAFYALYSIPFNYLHGFGLHADAAYNLPNIAANVFFVHGFYEPANNTVVPGGWSIATEMTFYAIFPLMFALSEHLGKWRLALGGCIFAFCAAVELIIGDLTGHWAWNTDFEYYSLLNQLPVFVIGILAYYMLKGSSVRKLPTAIAGILALVAAAGLLNSEAPMAYYIMPMFCACAFSALALVLSRISIRYPQFLVNIGKRSYSIYILHFAFLHFVLFGRSKLHAHLPPTLECLIVFLLTLGLSDIGAQITEGQIERRGINLGRRIVSAIQASGE
jgi:peptidoglycan/LPS O-acetylase OafA/YrhL